MRSAAALLGLAALVACRAAPPAYVPAGYRLVYSQDFAHPGTLGELAFSDPDSWRWWSDPGPSVAGPGGRGGPSTALELAGASRYGPPHRSPHSIALVRDLAVGDFVLEAELMQTGREYGHRDLCLFFGFESPERYYYVHLATTPDANAHNVFLVDGAPRRNLAPAATEGVDWGTEVWHRVRLERTLADGSIRVFFDDDPEPVIEARDRTLGSGRIGIGSFDDTGRFARVRIWGRKIDAPPAGPLF